MKILRMGKLAALCAALGSLALAGAQTARAQGAPIDLSDTSTRMVNVQFDPSMAPVPGMLSFADGTASIMVPNEAPAAPTFGPIMLGGGIMVSFANGRFDMIGPRTIAIDVDSGAARVSQGTTGKIDFAVMVGNLPIMQELVFNTRTIAATDLGPVFSARVVRDPNAPGVTSGAPLTIPGDGRACAMTGSGLLAMDVGIAECTPEKFAELQQLDPKGFDPATGAFQAVGTIDIIVPRFTVAGVVMVNVQPIQNAAMLTVTITEQ